MAEAAGIAEAAPEEAAATAEVAPAEEEDEDSIQQNIRS